MPHWFLILAIPSVLIVLLLLALVLFEPGLEYKVTPPAAALESDPFLCVLGRWRTRRFTITRGSRC